MRKLVIFGNGLGRALDSDYFQLEVALQQAWADQQILSQNQKSLILQCLPPGVIEKDLSVAPKSEAELDKLQRVLAACDEIAKHEVDGGTSWLTEDGKKFPFAIRSFVHRTASYFHSGGHSLPSDFVDSLADWVHSSRSHVATLNYDGLLYRAFVGSRVFDGFKCLLDGFVPDFDPENLTRYNPASQSFYLHLHGSPLFFNAAQGELKKSGLSELPFLEGYSSTHLVLTHVHHKAAVISASPILREYWRQLETAMEEAESIILFGYGGGDIHLNNLISRYFGGKQVEVVERRHAEYDTKAGNAARFEYWKSKLGVKAVWIFWHENILEHKNWTWKSA